MPRRWIRNSKPQFSSQRRELRLKSCRLSHSIIATQPARFKILDRIIFHIKFITCSKPFHYYICKCACPSSLQSALLNFIPLADRLLNMFSLICHTVILRCCVSHSKHAHHTVFCTFFTNTCVLLPWKLKVLTYNISISHFCFFPSPIFIYLSLLHPHTHTHTLTHTHQSLFSPFFIICLFGLAFNFPSNNLPSSQISTMLAEKRKWNFKQQSWCISDF